MKGKMMATMATQIQVTAAFKKELKNGATVCSNGMIRRFQKRGLIVTNKLMDTAARETMGAYEFSNCIYQPSGTGAKLREFMDRTGFAGHF